tara:strand:+ start:222 stop:872 length:651 start_codon:yes stop_codon:yes gene_type:complete
MSNTKFKNRNLITPEKAALILPTFVASIFSLLIIMIFVIPKYINSNKVNSTYKEFLRKKEDLTDLKLQYQIINQKLNKLNKEKSFILNLISGNTNLDTFLENLGNIAIKNNISFLSLVPDSSVMFVEKTNSNIQSELNIVPDPLLVEGLKKYIIDLSFESNFQNLLSFFRELESQENVILFSDIKLEKLTIETNQNLKSNNNLLKTNLRMTIYGKI